MTSDDCKQLHRKEGKQMPRTYVEEKNLSNLITVEHVDCWCVCPSSGHSCHDAQEPITALIPKKRCFKNPRFVNKSPGRRALKSQKICDHVGDGRVHVGKKCNSSMTEGASRHNSRTSATYTRLFSFWYTGIFYDLMHYLYYIHIIEEWNLKRK